jgi:uncharacterized protein (DUF2267 family)
VTTTVATPSRTVLADLVLVRMSLTSNKPVAPSLVRADVGKLLGADLSASEFDDVRNELASNGFLLKGNRNTFTVTDAGRARALRFLGIDALPARTNWQAVIANYLFPRAAGLTPHAAAKLNNGDKLAAFILKRKYGLAASAGSTVNQVLEAVACQKLNFPEETTLDGVLRAVLSRLIGSERLSKEKLAAQLPLFETGLTAASASAGRSKVVRDWLRSRPHEPRSEAHEERPSERPSVEPFDLPVFAATVRALAASSPPQDRFHHNKVFISAIWKTMQREPHLPRLSLEEFKQRLLEANSQGLLQLSRADLVQAMDPQLVAEAETRYLNAQFHFVLLEGSQP